jgi:hypothetical protein
MSSEASIVVGVAKRATLVPLRSPGVPVETVGECMRRETAVVVPITAPGAQAVKALVDRLM